MLENLFISGKLKFNLYDDIIVINWEKKTYYCNRKSKVRIRIVSRVTILMTSIVRTANVIHHYNSERHRIRAIVLIRRTTLPQRQMIINRVVLMILMPINLAQMGITINIVIIQLVSNEQHHCYQRRRRRRRRQRTKPQKPHELVRFCCPSAIQDRIII